MQATLNIYHREAEARQRFRQTLDEDIQAEFINGDVVRQMTARHSHTMAVRNLNRLLGAYVQLHNLGVVVQEQALTGFTRNDYAPDIGFWATAKAATIKPSTTIYPVPDFIAEVISPSTESSDRGVKFEDYAAHGVGEYWIVDPEARTIEQYVIQQGRYELAGKFAQGNIGSTVIMGFHIPVAAVFDDQANLAALRELLA